MSEEDPAAGREPGLRVAGLCASCRHARRVTSVRSEFLDDGAHVARETAARNAEAESMRERYAARTGTDVVIAAPRDPAEAAHVGVEALGHVL